ncbi:MAG: putative ABC transporter permease [Firmicutes bacterium]|nr:putative ABC transporter permease [Bacillota bacterium]MCL2771668.1 putative ABC transporter permease [Bacillota bacterium]
MKTILIYLTLIVVGSILGYYYEVGLRKILGKQSEVRLRGPYHPIYGIGIALSFLICSLIKTPWVAFVSVAVAINAAEYFGGLVCNKYLDLNLWDYSKYPFNLHGQICLTHSIGWVGAAALFAFLLFPVFQRVLIPVVCLVLLSISIVSIFSYFASEYFLAQKKRT